MVRRMEKLGESLGVPSLNLLAAQQSQGSTQLPSSLAAQGSGDQSLNLLSSQQSGKYVRTGFSQDVGEELVLLMMGCRNGGSAGLFKLLRSLKLKFQESCWIPRWLRGVYPEESVQGEPLGAGGAQGSSFGDSGKFRQERTPSDFIQRGI